MDKLFGCCFVNVFCGFRCLYIILHCEMNIKHIVMLKSISDITLKAPGITPLKIIL